MRDVIGRDLRVMSCVKEVCEFVVKHRDVASHIEEVGTERVRNVIEKTKNRFSREKKI